MYKDEEDGQIGRGSALSREWAGRGGRVNVQVFYVLDKKLEVDVSDGVGQYKRQRPCRVEEFAALNVK